MVRFFVIWDEIIKEAFLLYESNSFLYIKKLAYIMLSNMHYV